MTIKKLVVGFLDTNCYILSSGKRAVLIDPGENVERILKELDGLTPVKSERQFDGVKLEKIILTHLHFDHIIAAKKIKEATSALICCNKEDFKILNNDLLKEEDVDENLRADFKFKILNLNFKIIHTPGHTEGSICLYDEKNKILFSGDTIFAGSIGVTNYPGGDFKKIKRSIEKKLLTLPDDTLVYPGHYKEFRLGDEKEAIKSILEQ
ncbi:MAG: MBL fold metallo-hydrolase [Patescibacteria group bacterium]|nr:MBL fold metallo-hydrolase [Patescibacteria group bacterium]